jgi:hypothetical protein
MHDTIRHWFVLALVGVLSLLAAVPPAYGQGTTRPGTPGESFENPIELGSFYQEIYGHYDIYLDPANYPAVKGKDGNMRREVFFSFKLNRTMDAFISFDGKVRDITFFDSKRRPKERLFEHYEDAYFAFVQGLGPGTYYAVCDMGDNNGPRLKNLDVYEATPDTQYHYDRSGNRTGTVTTTNLTK